MEARKWNDSDQTIQNKAKSKEHRVSSSINASKNQNINYMRPLSRPLLGNKISKGQ